MRKLFDGMDKSTQRFYSRVLNTATLNIHAYRRGYFDDLICESTDPDILIRWRYAVPEVVELIKRDNAREEEDGQEY